jgi:hypothetical protein
MAFPAIPRVQDGTRARVWVSSTASSCSPLNAPLPDPCANILERFYAALEIGIPVNDVADWKASLLRCHQQGSFGDQEYTAAIAAL